MMLLPLYDQVPDAAVVWTANASAVANSSVAAAPPSALRDVNWQAQIDLVRSNTPREVSSPDLAPARAFWRLYSTRMDAQSSQISEIGNKSATVGDYFFFDDEPFPILGATHAVSNYGPLGYWHAISSGSDTYSVIAHGLDVTSLIGEIASLDDGWNGPGSLAPKAAVCSDISSVMNALWNICREPEIEVGDDGDVALLWDDQDRSFALTFLGNGKVIGTLTPLDSAYKPWSAPVGETQALREKIANLHVSALLA